MNERSFIFAAAVLLGAAACHKAQPAAAAKPECVVRADCASGLLCVSGQCAGCLKSASCDLDEVCDPVQKRCTLKPCFGDACVAHSDCAAGLFCVQGLCLDPAKPLAQGGQTCAVVLCGSARDCNPGQLCNGRTFVCETDLGCQSGDPCPANQACNATSGVCEESCTEATATAVCGAFTPCIGGRCVQCAADSDCGPGLTCNVGLGQCQGPSACQSSRDCTVPLLCDRPTGTCEAARPPCDSNEQCATDERCDSRLSLCIAGACEPDRFEPNGTMATAAPLAPGSYPELTLCGAEEDWFSLALQSGDTVQVVSDADPLGSFDLQLLDANDQLLEEGTAAVEHLVGSTGTYYLRARTNDASALYGLQIEVAHGTACVHNPPDAHPTAPQALPLPAGPSYSWTVCPGEATYFVLRVAAGQGAAVTASLDPTAGGALQLALYDSDGTTLLARDATGSATPSVTAGSSMSSLFFLRVAGLDESVSTSYDLTVRLLQ